MLSDKIYSLMGVDPQKPLAERIAGLTAVAKEVPRETVKTVGTIAKEIAKAPVRVAMTPADVVSQVATGKSLPPLDIPVLGEAKSYGRQQEEDIKTGQDPLAAGAKNIAQGAADLLTLAPLFNVPASAAPNTRLYRGENATNRGGNYYTYSKDVAKRYGDDIIERDIPKRTFDTFKQELPDDVKSAMKYNIDDIIARGEKVTDEAFYKPLFDKGYDAVVLSDRMTGEPNILLNPARNALAVGASMAVPEEKRKTILERIMTGDISDTWVLSEDPRKVHTDALLSAIAHNESRGEKEPYTTTTKARNRKGNFALGKYQVTTDELKTYAERFLGRKVTDKEFKSNPSLQEKYMRNKIAFLFNEGLTPGEILASHRRGLPNWGDDEKLTEKRKQSVQYIRDGMEQFIQTVKERDPKAFDALVNSYVDRPADPTATPL